MPPRRTPRVEGRPGAEVVGELPQPVLDLGAHREGAMDAVGTVGRCLVFATPDAHVTGETGKWPRRLRLECLLDPCLPPRIRRRGPVGGGDRGSDRGFHLGGLHGDQLDVHGPKS
jgi:hypothetical protein